MRLWHEKLIPKLSDQHLLGQHREVAALRGLGWGRKHATVDYVFIHNTYKLIRYHRLVMKEMIKRGFKPNLIWDKSTYRGKRSLPWNTEDLINDACDLDKGNIYPEHDDVYLNECLLNLEKKGYKIEL